MKHKLHKILRIVFCLLLIAIVTCCSKKEKQPLDVTIPVDTMASIIRDMQKSEYMLSSIDKDSVDYQSLKSDYAISILKHYKTDLETYRHDLKIYLQDEKTMKVILEKAMQ